MFNSTKLTSMELLCTEAGCQHYRGKDVVLENDMSEDNNMEQLLVFDYCTIYLFRGLPLFNIIL